MFSHKHGIWLHWKSVEGERKERWFPTLAKAEHVADYLQSKGATEICVKLPKVEKKAG